MANANARNKPFDATAGQIMRFPKGAELEALFDRTMSLISLWCGALNEHYDFNSVVDRLAEQTAAVNLVVLRAALDGSNLRTVAATTRDPNRSKPEAANRDLIAFLMTRHRISVLPGTIWRLSELRDDPTFAASGAGRYWARQTHVNEVSLIILGRTDTVVDLIELVFHDTPPRHPKMHSAIIVREMVAGWKMRRVGLIGRLIASYGRSQDSVSHCRDAEDLAILDPLNPYALSRSELRICQLLDARLKPREMATELGVSIATVRTHLRNIYSKTNSSGQVDVMSKLRHGQYNSDDADTVDRAG